MSKEKTSKKLHANWFRKGGIALTAIAAVVVCLYLLYAISIDTHNTGNIVDGIPNIVVYIIIWAVAVIGVLTFFYQAISLFINKMVLNQDGIEIKRFLKRVSIAKSDIIRVDGIHERVIGAPTKNRTVFKIITNTKTYEINSHEFSGLRRAMSNWVQGNMTTEEKDINEG